MLRLICTPFAHPLYPVRAQVLEGPDALPIATIGGRTQAEAVERVRAEARRYFLSTGEHALAEQVLTLSPEFLRA